jgi:hypothetical protein
MGLHYDVFSMKTTYGEMPECSMNNELEWIWKKRTDNGFISVL